MADDDFEADLKALFADAPTGPDARAFAARVRGRIEGRQRIRLALVAATGAAGLGWLGAQVGALDDVGARLSDAAASFGGVLTLDQSLAIAAVLSPLAGWLLLRSDEA